MKFLIVNSFHRDDKGDAALVHVLTDQLLKIDPGANIQISSMEDSSKYPNFYKGTNVGSFELQSSSHIHKAPFHLFFKVYIFFSLGVIGAAKGKFSWLLTKDLKKIYDACNNADLVVSVGGGYFLSNRGVNSKMHLLFVLQTLGLCKRLGRKVVTAPVSVGPFENSLEAKLAAHQLKKLDLVLLREDISKQYFINKKGELPANVKRLPDSAFAFNPEGEFNLRNILISQFPNINNLNILAISVRYWQGKEQQINYEQAHADLLDFICAQFPNILPVFIPQCVFPEADDDDREVAKRILNLSKSKNLILLKEDLDYKQVKQAYSQADYVVGTRFHSLVFGLSYNVPGIAIEYEPKTRGIMRDLDLEQWVIPIGEISSKNLINLFKNLVKVREAYKQQLLKIMPKYITSANEVANMFSNILKR